MDKFAKNIEFLAILCYYIRMNQLTQIKTSVFGVDFHYSKSKIITEREIHDYHEFLFYIDGNATFRTETYRKKLSNFTLIFIPKGKYHIFTPENPESFTRLKISFKDGDITANLPEDFLLDVKLISNLEPFVLSLFEDIISVLKNGVDQTDGLRIYGNFLTALSSFAKINCATYGKNYSPVVHDCFEYIENNLSTDLTIQNLSKVLGCSASALSHAFKNQTGISLHGYISQKRLALAKTLLDKGEKPTEIYLKCGYKDYSSFYKAYVKAFSVNPKK